MYKDITLSPLPHKRLSDAAADALSSYIETLRDEGKLKLPPETELAKALGVSRTTIRRTLSNMENKGVVVRLHGKGTFINPDAAKIRLNFASSQPRLSLIETCGYTASQKTLYCIKSAPSVLQQSILTINETDMLYTIARIYYADKTPIIFSVDDVPEKFFDFPITRKRANVPTYLMIEKYAGIICKREETTLSSTSASSVKSFSEGRELLSCETALELNTVVYSDRNIPIYTSKEFIDTNYIQFHMLRTLDVF